MPSKIAPGALKENSGPRLSSKHVHVHATFGGHFFRTWRSPLSIKTSRSISCGKVKFTEIPCVVMAVIASSPDACSVLIFIISQPISTHLMSPIALANSWNWNRYIYVPYILYRDRQVTWSSGSKPRKTCFFRLSSLIGNRNVVAISYILVFCISIIIMMFFSGCFCFGIMLMATGSLDLDCMYEEKLDPFLSMPIYGLVWSLSGWFYILDFMVWQMRQAKSIWNRVASSWLEPGPRRSFRVSYTKCFLSSLWLWLDLSNPIISSYFITAVLQMIVVMTLMKPAIILL